MSFHRDRNLRLTAGCAAQPGGPEGARPEGEVPAGGGEGGCQCLRGGPFPRAGRPGWRTQGGGRRLLRGRLPRLEEPSLATSPFLRY